MVDLAQGPPTLRIWSAGRSAACAGLIFGLQAISVPASLGGQELSETATPAVFRTLEGAWAGTGVLLGRPGAFRMEWETRPQGFVRLVFSNAWVAESGESTPVLAAEATYFVRGSSAVGVWVDTRPQQLTLSAVITDSPS